MPEDDLDLLIQAAMRAGDIARGHFRGNPQTWEKADGAGPVTEADLEVDRMLFATLQAARPDYGWLSEESEDHPARRDAETLFIIDPIDGTRSFIAGERAWAHSLAIARGGEIVAGVVYLPMMDRLYTARLGGGATLNGDPIAISGRSEMAGATVLANAASLDPARWPGGAPEVVRHFRPSLAYRMCLVAQGRFDAMLSLRDSWEWDIAAGALIVAEAGGEVTDADGQPHRFNADHPASRGVIAASPGLGAALRARLVD